MPTLFTYYILITIVFVPRITSSYSAHVGLFSSKFIYLKHRDKVLSDRESTAGSWRAILPMHGGWG